jgi:hypothetical protein
MFDSWKDDEIDYLCILFLLLIEFAVFDVFDTIGE